MTLPRALPRDDEPSTSRGAEAGANSIHGTEREATNAQATTAAADGGARSRDERGKGGGTSPRGRAAKKPRLVWTPELHMRFMNAVNHLGIKNAVPKTILQLMNVEGMTRENVASHLQKYRLYLKRVAGIPFNAPIPADIMQRVAPYQMATGVMTGAPVPFMPTIEQMHAGVAPTPMHVPSPAVPFPPFPGAPYPPMSVSDPFAAQHAAAAATMRAQGYAAAMGIGGRRRRRRASAPFSVICKVSNPAWRRRGTARWGRRRRPPGHRTIPSRGTSRRRCSRPRWRPGG